MPTRTRKNAIAAASLLAVVAFSVFLSVAPSTWSGSVVIALGFLLLGTSIYGAHRRPQEARVLLRRGALQASGAGLLGLYKLFDQSVFLIGGLLLVAGILINERLAKTRSRLRLRNQ